MVLRPRLEGREDDHALLSLGTTQAPKRGNGPSMRRRAHDGRQRFIPFSKLNASCIPNSFSSVYLSSFSNRSPASPNPSASIPSSRKPSQTHPELRFYEAQVDVASAGKTKAGEIKNPDLMTGVGNWRVRDLTTNNVTDGPTWAVQLTQTFEWPGRLSLRKAIAQKRH
jgi:hypothetical protein